MGHRQKPCGTRTGHVRRRAAAAASLLAATALAGCAGGTDPEPPEDTPTVSEATYAAAMEAFGYVETDDDGWARASYGDLVLGGSTAVRAGSDDDLTRLDRGESTLPAGDYYLEVQCYGVEIPGERTAVTWSRGFGDDAAAAETTAMSCPAGAVTTALAPIEVAEPQSGFRMEIAAMEGVTAVVDYALYRGEMPPQE